MPPPEWTLLVLWGILGVMGLLMGILGVRYWFVSSKSRLFTPFLLGVMLFAVGVYFVSLSIDHFTNYFEQRSHIKVKTELVGPAPTFYFVLYLLLFTQCRRMKSNRKVACGY